MGALDREVMEQLIRSSRAFRKALAERLDKHDAAANAADSEGTAPFDPREVMRSAMRKGINSLPLEQRILMQMGIEERESQQARRFVLLLFDSYGTLNRTAIKGLCHDVPGVDDIDALLSSLEEEGLIEREGLAGAAQNGTFCLSEAGEETVRRMLTKQDEAAADFLSPLDDDEKAELARLLGKLATGLGKRAKQVDR